MKSGVSILLFHSLLIINFRNKNVRIIAHQSKIFLTIQGVQFSLSANQLNFGVKNATILDEFFMDGPHHLLPTFINSF